MVYDKQVMDYMLSDGVSDIRFERWVRLLTDDEESIDLLVQSKRALRILRRLMGDTTVPVEPGAALEVGND